MSHSSQKQGSSFCPGLLYFRPKPTKQIPSCMKYRYCHKWWDSSYPLRRSLQATISNLKCSFYPLMLIYLQTALISLISFLFSFTSVQSLSRVWLFATPWPQHTSPPCPSPTPGVYPNSCPSSRWCHPTISSSVIPFSSCPQFFPASGSFQMSQLFTSGGQSIGVSASASVLLMNIQDWFSFRMDWVDLLVVQWTLKSLLQNHSSKASILRLSAFFLVQLSHPYRTTGKTIALTRQSFAGKVMSLLFNIMSGLVITFLPMSKRLLISWLQSPSAVILEPKKIKSVTVSTVLHLFPMKWWDQMPWS